MSASSIYLSFDSDESDDNYNDENEFEGSQKVVEMKFSGNRTELVDELGSLSFSIFDGASVAEWRGKDLRLADNIPNIDLLVLGIEKDNVNELESVLDIHSGIMSYIARYWRGFYPLLLIELTAPNETSEDKDIYQSKLDQLNGLFGDVHHIEIDQNSLKDPSTWEWLNECMARLFIHSRLYQCSRFYGKRIYLENKCPGGCELRKISKQKSRDKFKSVSKKISNIRALSIKQTRA